MKTQGSLPARFSRNEPRSREAQAAIVHAEPLWPRLLYALFMGAIRNLTNSLRPPE